MRRHAIAAVAALTLAACAEQQPSLSASGCAVDPDPALFSHVGELVDRSPRIVLATTASHRPKREPVDGVVVRISSATPSKGETRRALRRGLIEAVTLRHGEADYTLTVVEDLKGTGPEQIELTGARPPDMAAFRAAAAWSGRTPDFRYDEHFGGHTAPRFWEDREIGRSYVPPQGTRCPDASASPVFLAGATYLVFLGPPHVKGYEVIHAADDRWLDFVRRRIADPAAQPDRSPPATNGAAPPHGLDLLDPSIMPPITGPKRAEPRGLCLVEPPASMFAAPGELVDRAERIVLAEFFAGHASSIGVDATPLDPAVAEQAGLRRITLRVAENLKGAGEKEIVVPALAKPSFMTDLDFQGHRDPRFWQGDDIGRGYPVPELRGTCPPAVAQPSFNDRSRYLIFFGPQHVKGYEVIRSDDDLWLDYVRNRIADPAYQLDRSKLRNTSP